MVGDDEERAAGAEALRGGGEDRVERLRLPVHRTADGEEGAGRRVEPPPPRAGGGDDRGAEVAGGAERPPRRDPPGDGAGAALAGGVEQVGDLPLVQPVEECRRGLPAAFGVEPHVERLVAAEREAPASFRFVGFGGAIARGGVVELGAGEAEVEQEAVEMLPADLVEDRVEVGEVAAAEAEARVGVGEGRGGGEGGGVLVEGQQFGGAGRGRVVVGRCRGGRRAEDGLGVPAASEGGVEVPPAGPGREVVEHPVEQHRRVGPGVRRAVADAPIDGPGAERRRPVGGLPGPAPGRAGQFGISLVFGRSRSRRAAPAAAGRRSASAGRPAERRREPRRQAADRGADRGGGQERGHGRIRDGGAVRRRPRRGLPDPPPSADRPPVGWSGSRDPRPPGTCRGR